MLESLTSAGVTNDAKTMNAKEGKNPPDTKQPNSSFQFEGKLKIRQLVLGMALLHGAGVNFRYTVLNINTLVKMVFTC